MPVRVFITRICEEIKKRKFYITASNGISALGFEALPEVLLTRAPVGLFRRAEKHLQRELTKDGVARIVNQDPVELDLEELEMLEDALEEIGSKRSKGKGRKKN